MLGKALVILFVFATFPSLRGTLKSARKKIRLFLINDGILLSVNFLDIILYLIHFTFSRILREKAKFYYYLLILYLNTVTGITTLNNIEYLEQ